MHDAPEDSELKMIDLQSGDILMMASDGFWDNLPASKIMDVLPKIKQDPSPLEDICPIITIMAREHSEDEEFMSPFACKAKDHGIDTIGGKIDDITLILFRVY